MNNGVKRSFKIISKDVCNGKIFAKAAIIIYLYYLDIVEYFYRYLKMIPEEIDIYIITSRVELKNKISNDFPNHKNINIMLKENRGRDISALLVSSSRIIDNYEYICYLHDKKTKSSRLKEDTDLWIKNLWDNLICSKEYINNVINTFEENKEIGLVLPPERFGTYFHDWEYSEWSELDFKYAEKILCMLGIKVSLSREIPPISIGSMLWFKRNALKKLFIYDWKYEDFPDEPLPDDGTINHAIERIFPYIAHEAGYESLTVMSDEYASVLLNHCKEFSEKSYLLLKKAYGFINTNDYEMADLLVSKLQAESREKKRLFLFGAGKEGKYCLRYLRMRGIEPDGFIVSCDITESVIEGINVYGMCKIASNNTDVCIIITVFDAMVKMKIKDLIEKYGINDYLFWKSE